ncbi:MAG: hypothetical protein HZC36_00260 [Armatimonadetes bacterium]|nr:hypothetical protein [Armatimonadota bacterium]
MNDFSEWTSLPVAWAVAKLFAALLLICLWTDHVAKKKAGQIPKGADAWNPDGVKLRMISDRESISRN